MKIPLGYPLLVVLAVLIPVPAQPVVVSNMADPKESGCSSRSSKQKISLQESLRNLKTVTDSLKSKKPPKPTEFFNYYNGSGKRVHTEKSKHRSGNRRTIYI